MGTGKMLDINAARVYDLLNKAKAEKLELERQLPLDHKTRHRIRRLNEEIRDYGYLISRLGA